MTNRAKAVAALASEWAEAGDREGQLAAPVVEALHREGLLGMWVPRTVHGGAELGPLPSLRILEEVSYGDASAGWVLMAAALATGTGGAYLGDEAVARLFGHDRLPVIAGQGTRPGYRHPCGRRVPPDRIVELRVRNQACVSHPHAGCRARHG
jgi:alkylation response protein AidB-like acyl-CoA dehydrogenase